jgi:hypothetical protein
VRDLTRIRRNFSSNSERSAPSLRRLVVQGTADRKPRFVQDVGINHGGGDVFVAQEVLYGADILPGFEYMCSKTVPEGVTTRAFGNPGQLF